MKKSQNVWPASKDQKEIDIRSLKLKALIEK